ncbi:hypothetical protein L208DRAFT_1357879 [Tricholoma matsutake]|nr:hypothetical protein L208DRAFT_1357879 [Tricholoma matsutake 945]
MSKVQDDPRDPSLETKETLPYTWIRDDMADAFGTSGMLLSGLIVVTRNRNIAWGAILFGISGIINSHSLRAKSSSGSPLSSFLMCITACVALYFPLFVITNPPPAATT